jgi:hypothetical protein
LTGRERQIYVAAEQVTARTGLSRLTLPRELDIPGHCRIVEAAHHYKAHVETGSARVLIDQTDFPDRPDNSSRLLKHAWERKANSGTLCGSRTPRARLWN